MQFLSYIRNRGIGKIVFKRLIESFFLQPNSNRITQITGNQGKVRLSYGLVRDTRSLGYGTAAPLHHLDIYAANGSLADLSTALLGSTGTRRTDVRISTDLAGEVYFTNKRNGWIHRMLPPPGVALIPWPDTFPDAVEVSPGILETDSMGLLSAAAWPWIYSYSIGWFMVAEPAASPEPAGIWIFKPK